MPSCLPERLMPPKVLRLALYKVIFSAISLSQTKSRYAILGSGHTTVVDIRGRTLQHCLLQWLQIRQELFAVSGSTSSNLRAIKCSTDDRISFNYAAHAIEVYKELYFESMVTHLLNRRILRFLIFPFSSSSRGPLLRLPTGQYP